MNSSLGKSFINKMGKLFPIFMMNQEGLKDLEKKSVLEGASELIKLAKVGGIEIFDLGIWRNKDFIDANGALKPYQSVDWYIQRGKETSRNRNQLNIQMIGQLLVFEPWRDKNKGGKDHYDILVLHSDMYQSEDTNFVIGSAAEGIGTIISTYRFNQLEDRERYECIKTETMHELGHVFGLIPKNRKKDVKKSLGKHCTNICVMRQGLNVPEDWIKMTNDRLRYGVLCPACEKDLINYFKE